MNHIPNGGIDAKALRIPIGPSIGLDVVEVTSACLLKAMKCQA